MRRSLVLTDESARHPFRASLPPHARKPAPARAEEAHWRLDASDIRGFATAYFACFAAALIFLI